MMRWTLVTDTRVVPSPELVNARLELVGEHSFKIVHLATAQECFSAGFGVISKAS
jgi:hypothetical protein